MKKVLLAFAVASIFAACNDSKTNTTTTSDSTNVKMDTAIATPLSDSTKVTVDTSARKMSQDTIKTNVQSCLINILGCSRSL